MIASEKNLGKLMYDGGPLNRLQPIAARSLAISCRAHHSSNEGIRDDNAPSY
jgi:hypothetical protein